MAIIGFIGTGNMGGAPALAAGRNTEGDRILLFDKDKQTALRISHGIPRSRVTERDELVETAHYIFIGVKPQMLQGLFDEIRPALKRRDEAPVLVSMAAGVSIQRIREYCGMDFPVVRIMPNVPVSVGAGLVMISRDDLVSDEEFSAVLRILTPAGEILPIEERLIDAGSAVSGCGPAFAAMFIEALADGGVLAGLPRETAAILAAQTLFGTSVLLTKNRMHPGTLKDMVCSPAGTTIEGVRTLEEQGMRAAVMDAVIAAYEKTKKLG